MTKPDTEPLPLSSTELQDLRTAFDLFSSQNGLVRLGDVYEILVELENNRESKTLQRLLQVTKEEPDRRLNFEAFCELIAVDPSDTRDDMKKVFEMFDTSGKGYIDASDLKAQALDLGEALSDEDLDEMIRRVSSSSEGKVFFEDFVAIMNRSLF
jgi:Ca2+-binding EF-hand superfamily protein